MKNEFTMLELLEDAGMAERIQDSQLTRQIAKRLRAKGYRMVRRGSRHVWTTSSVGEDNATLAARLTEGL